MPTSLKDVDAFLAQGSAPPRRGLEDVDRFLLDSQGGGASVGRGPGTMPDPQRGWLRTFLSAALENLVPEPIRDPSMLTEVPGAVRDLTEAGRAGQLPLETGLGGGNPVVGATIAQAGRDIVGSASAASQEQFEKGNTVGGIGAAVPIIGPPAAQAGEEIGSGNVAAGLGHAAGLLVPFAAKGTAGALRPAAEPIRNLARRNYSRALGATTKPLKQLAEQKVVPELLERRVTAATRKGFERKARAGTAVAADALEEALDRVPPGTKVKTARIAQDMEALAQERLVEGRGGQPIATDPTAVKNLRDLGGQAAGLDPAFENVRRYRQQLDKDVTAGNKAHGRTLTEGTVIDAKREASNSTRAALARAAPDVAKANKEFTFWKSLEDILAETNLRTSSQAAPLGESLMEAGAVAGALGSGGSVGKAAAAGAVGKAIKKAWNSTGRRTLTAAQEAKLADLISSGQMEEAAGLVRTFGMGSAASRTPDERTAIVERALRDREFRQSARTPQDARSAARMGEESSPPDRPARPEYLGAVQGGSGPRVRVRKTGEEGTVDGYEKGDFGRVVRVRIGSLIRRFPANAVTPIGEWR